jgi:hypothetical protein
MRLSSIGNIFWSSSIFQNIEEVFHFLKIEVVFHIPKDWGRLPFLKNWGRLPFPENWGRLPFANFFRLSSYLSLTPPLHGYLVKFCSFPAISLLVRVGGRPAGRAAGRVLDIAKLKLNSASLVELGLGLSLAKNAVNSGHLAHASCTDQQLPRSKLKPSFAVNSWRLLCFLMFTMFMPYQIKRARKYFSHLSQYYHIGTARTGLQDLSKD